MNIRLALAMVGLFACHDDTECTAPAYLDNFRVVIKDDAWLREDYRIIVSYAASGDAGPINAYLCDVRVPAYSWSGALDGGVAVVDGDDGGPGSPDSRNSQPCRMVSGVADPSAAPVSVDIGRALELTFPGTPARAKLEISMVNGVLLEHEFELSYRVYAAQCDGPSEAHVEVQLP
jgi:hypothetical protein